jgi:hypothetical protein
MRTHSTLAALVIFGLGAAGCASRPDPESVLRASFDACGPIESGRYHAEYRRMAASEDDLVRTAWVSYERLEGDEVRARVRLEFDDGRLVAYDGKRLRTWLPKEERLLEVLRPLAPSFITGNIDKYLLWTPLVEPGRLLVAWQLGELAYVGRAEADGVECDVIRVTLPGLGDAESFVDTWFIGREDRLPRRWERVVPGAGENRVSLALSEIQSLDPMPKRLFELAPPGVTPERFPAGD